MSRLRILYLALAVWGAAHPTWHFWRWLSTNGFDLRGMFALWSANDAVMGLSLDLVVAAVALCAWIVAEVMVRRNWSSLIAIPATLLIGVGCGLPLYLFLRTRAA